MKTISIHNGVVWTEKKKFKVTVNGEEHMMHDKFLNVDVDDDVPVEIKVKHGRWYISSTYKFEQRENMVLQILINQPLVNRVLLWTLILIIAAVISVCIIWYSNKERRVISFLPYTLICLPLVGQVFMKKKYMIICEN